MGKKIKIELNRAGVKELLKSSEMQGALSRIANRALASLGDGYEVDSYVASTRAVSEVATASYKAMRENMDNNTILNAVGSAGE